MTVLRHLIMLGAMACAAPLSAQIDDYEERFNPVTGQTERIFNPWNENANLQRRWEMDRDYNDLVRRHGDEARELDQWWDKRDAERDRQGAGRVSAAGLIQQRLAKGRARIKAGKASTSFAPQPGFSVTAYLLDARAKTPQERQAATQYGTSLSQAYHSEIKARGLRANDVADGYALDFILAWELWSGRKTTAAHLAFARTEARKFLIHDLIFQGGGDAERQMDFEYFGVLTLYARQVAAQNQSLARQIAEAVITSVIRGSVDTVEMTATGFAHKGQRIIAQGKATTLFAARTGVGTPEFYARQLNAQTVPADVISRQAQQKIAAFYAEMGKYGGTRNDLASLAAMLLAANASVVTGQIPNARQIASAERVARAAILKSPDIQAASDQNKQLAAELLMIKAVDAMQARSAAMGCGNIAQIFAALGEKPEDYQLTEAGLVKVK